MPAFPIEVGMNEPIARTHSELAGCTNNQDVSEAIDASEVHPMSSR